MYNDSPLENCKIIKGILFSIMLNYLTFIIKFWMGSVYAWKHQLNHKACMENTLLYNIFFWQSAVIMYNNLLTKYMLNWADGWITKSVFMQHIFILSEYLSENFVRYCYIRFNMIKNWNRIKKKYKVYILSKTSLSFILCLLLQR